MIKLDNTHGPLVFGHRGASGYCPENTLLSFARAIELDADGIELDVQMSRDGQLVIIHDETLDRTSTGKGFVKDHDFAELRSYNYNKNFPELGYCTIPTLEEVLDLIKPSRLMINIEIKDNIINYPNIVERVMDLVNEKEMKERVLYSSFNHYSCLKVREKDPDAYVGFLYEDGFIGVPRYVREHRGNALHPALYFLLDPLYMKKAEGLDVNVWTINEPYQMKMACRLGINTIITNYPDVARKIVTEYSEKS